MGCKVEDSEWHGRTPLLRTKKVVGLQSTLCASRTTPTPTAVLRSDRHRDRNQSLLRHRPWRPTWPLAGGSSLQRQAPPDRGPRRTRWLAKVAAPRWGIGVSATMALNGDR